MSTQEFALQSLNGGPDEIYAQVQGYALYGFLMRYLGCGTYAGSFYIHYPGAYHIQITRMRSHFSAISEMVNEFPRINMEVAVSEWVQLVGLEGSAKDLAQSCRRESPGAWVEKSVVKSLHTPGSVERNPLFASVQAANLSKELVFRSFISEDHSRMLPLKSFVEIGSDHRNKSCFMVVNNYVWQPVGCGWKYYTAKEAGHILNGKKIAFVGDSHSRELRLALNHWACGEGACGSYESVHEQNTYCENVNEKLMLNGFITVFNCGQWPASQDHMSFKAYTDTLHRTMNKATGDGLNGHNMLWVQTNPQPWRQDHWPIDFKDWRTLTRLQLFNDYTDIMMTKRNLSVIYSFRPLIPLIDTGCDSSHYTEFNAQMPLFQQLLNYVVKHNVSS
jgi:hypothetical protein